MIGEIIISDDIDSTLDGLKSQLENYRIFHKSDFKMDDAKEVLEESYISSSSQKTLVLAAPKFNIYAQNALLKVLEEPPPNINFIIITKSKNAILPTILSRMIVRKNKAQTHRIEIDIDLENLSLNKITDFIKSLNTQDREEVRNLIESLLFKVKNCGISLNATELESFSNAVLQNEHYNNAKFIFLELLLMILESNARRNHAKIRA